MERIRSKTSEQTRTLPQSTALMMRLKERAPTWKRILLYRAPPNAAPSDCCSAIRSFCFDLNLSTAQRNVSMRKLGGRPH
eukprot:scaffold422_cov399-Prasinococcus_capsulatus_cf.AAC.3